MVNLKDDKEEQEQLTSKKRKKSRGSQIKWHPKLAKGSQLKLH